MANQWFITSDGKNQHGPYSDTRLKELAESGLLRAIDMVLLQGKSQWIQASSIKGLFFGSTQRPPTQPNTSAPAQLPANEPPQGRPRGGQQADLGIPDVLPVNAPRGRSAMLSGMEIINDVIPPSHQNMLMHAENAYHFEWMDTQGGCGTTQAAKQFILITDHRILYEASVKEGDGMNLKYVRTSGSIPISKVSYVGTSSKEAGCASAQQGCNPQHAHLLRINSGGGNIEFPFFNEQKVKRVQRVIEELISRK
jgi:hypothetical protein